MNKIITGGNALVDVNLVFAKAQIGDRTKVADLGCGASGHFIFPASKIVGKNGKVYAVDILKTVLENVKRKIKYDNISNIEAVWSDLEVFGATKIETESIDVVLLINTLYLSHKRVEIVREGSRMLKTGGKLLIVEWKNIASPFGPPPEERVKEELVKIACQKIGLRLDDEFSAGQYHYGLVFTKM